MTIEKIYKSLTKGELGVYRGTEVDQTDGKIIHVLAITNEDGTTEERQVSDSTFKRWWKLVEETTKEDLQDSLDTLNEIKDTVLNEQPTIEDLKQLNESGVELTEEELQLFKEQAQQVEQTKKEKKPVVKKERKVEDTGVAQYFESRVQEVGGSIMLYSEPMKRVVKNQSGKTVMFYMVRPNKSLKLYFKEQVDEVATGGVLAKEEHTYPKQFPFRLEVKQLDDNTKAILQHILDLSI